MLDLALTIARAGLRVVLIHTVNDAGACTCGRGDACPERTRGKHPIAVAWQKVATDDEQILRDQFARIRFSPNVGIALGVQSGGGYTVSIDDDDAARMAALEAELGELPHTMSGQSPRGAHLFFRLPADTPLDRIKNITGIGGVSGVDMKAAGGQVVVAGRNSGGEYTGLDVTVPIAELPAAWTLAILAPVKLPKTASTYTPDTLKADAKVKKRHEAYLEQSVVSECRILSRTGEGQRNTATYTAACRLLPIASGLHLHSAFGYIRREITRAAMSAGLTEPEASAAVASAERWVVERGIVRGPREVRNPEIDRAILGVEPVESAPAESDADSVELIEDNGQPAKIPENVARMLAVHPRGAPRLNLLAHRVEWPDGDRITDTDEVRIQGWLVSQAASQRVRVGLEAVHAGIQACAESRPFHPVRDYLGGLEWDGTTRIESFAKTCLGAIDSELIRGYMRCFFVGAVARAMVPGCQFDTVLVLEGAQGARKTTALRTLFGATWFGNTPINVKKQPDCYQALEGFWGYEMGELDAHSREAAATKAFVSMREDTYRPSYGRNTVSRARQVAFTATTNADTYLADETGARRYQCMKCGTVDVDRIATDRDQLWAEATALYTQGAAWWLTDELASAAAEDVDSRYQRDSWEDTLPQLLHEHAIVTTAAALLLLGVESAKQSRGDAMRVGAALRRMGWARHHIRRGGRKVYEFHKAPTLGGASR